MDEVLLQYGIAGVGLIALGFVVRVLFDQVKADKLRETERADRNEAALHELNRSVREQVIPAALDMVATTKALIDLMAHERSRRKE